MTKEQVSFLVLEKNITNSNLRLMLYPKSHQYNKIKTLFKKSHTYLKTARTHVSSTEFLQTHLLIFHLSLPRGKKMHKNKKITF